MLPVLLAGIASINFALAIAGYKRLLRWLERASNQPKHAASEGDILRAQRLTLLITTVGQYGPIRRNCLRCAMLAYYLLRRRGLNPTLHFGLPAASTASPFMAHAWVELNATPLLPTDAAYVAFERSKPTNSQSTM